jgi:hypothetical protein
MTKTQEITQKLQSGITPGEIIKQGYSHGLVYKQNKKLKENKLDTAVIRDPSKVNETVSIAKDVDIENDPEIFQLKREIRKAELERKLTDVLNHTDIVETINSLEKRIKIFEDFIDTPPLSDLNKKFKCDCGEEDYLGIRVQCMHCGKEYSCKK